MTKKAKTQRVPVDPKQAKSHASKPVIEKEVIDYSGVYEVPGGTLTVNKNGTSVYTGTPYCKIELKNKYTCYTPDRDASGKVKTKLGSK